VPEKNVCQICGVETPDIRHIEIDCFYDLSEVSEKFYRMDWYRKGKKNPKHSYLIRVCKGCRSVFMFDFLSSFIKYGKAFRLAQNIDEEGRQEVKSDA